LDVRRAEHCAAPLFASPEASGGLERWASCRRPSGGLVPPVTGCR